MATTILFQDTVSTPLGGSTVVIDYDDVAQNIGITVTGSGQPVLTVCRVKATGKSIPRALALAPLIGTGRNIELKNVASTDVLPLDADGVPTKVDVALTWSP